MINKKNKNFSKVFGNHLRKLRIEKGFGMREFALHVDMEYSQLSKIERGVINPTIATVLILAEGLEISHTELFDFPFDKK